MGATNIQERLAASIGLLDGVAPDFKDVLDVPQGGVLFALPALLANGLLRHAEKYFTLPKGILSPGQPSLVNRFYGISPLKKH